MIKQYVNGKSVGIVNASMSSADFSTLSVILAGRSENWEKIAEGGTVANAITPNFRKFSVGKVTMNGRISSSFTLPHLKASKSTDDIRGSVIGMFDADYVLTDKAEYCNGIGDSSRG
ncbi:MAG TPA: hypothetical protein VLZ29_06090 [Sulfurimonas sp.]|uniref:hypothetical protein n=1 Tax=Sulfurimonas sp. TaxID=2022749 RepID=UPI002C4780BF|nr:hypothetical protein [Sulfurimonas sp.]HUH42669.1 hypothetical protein [Sulfurimonas sp.]